MESEEYRARFETVREGIARAAASAGRAAEDLTLVAVSKLHPAQAVAELADLGQLDFGENYVQEALAKQDALAERDLRWHFIGRLQSNKAKFVVGRFALIHGLDSEKLARSLHNYSRKLSARGAGDVDDAYKQDVLIQVNLGLEPQKSGVMPEDLDRLADEVVALDGLRLLGLMCLPPLFEGQESSRPYFVRLRELRDGLAARLGIALPHLSMGMSMDFQAAIEEGATMVRVGTDLFGQRPCRL